MNWIIAIIVAVVYLTVSIVFNAWAYSWLIWVAYAIYRFIAKQKNNNLLSYLQYFGIVNKLVTSNNFKIVSKIIH